jgi:adenosine deaminase CECR1
VKGQLHFYRAHQVPPGFYSIEKLNDSIPGFEEQLHDLITFDGSPENDSTDVWTEFENCFRRIDGFVSYQPVFKDVYVACFDSLLADGVPHVELRVGLAGGLYDLEHSAGAFPADSVIAYLQQAAHQVQQKHNQAFTFKIIYANLRFRPLDAIKQDLVHAFAIRARYPDLVKAYDLVAHEDAGHATDYFREAWLMRDSLAKVYGVDLPLCLHDGESSWEHVTNLYDAVLLGSVRIGHGLNLSFFPGVEDLVRKQNICMEVSPLSNQILGYVGDLRMHPAHAWIKRGIQISISPDDPALFDYTGVTPDYWSICLAWELDLQALKKLSMNGILYSQLSEAEQQEALRVWQDRWQRFVAYANRVLQ